MCIDSITSDSVLNNFLVPICDICLLIGNKIYENIKRIVRKTIDFGYSLELRKMIVQNYVRNIRKYTFETLMKIAKKYGYTVTIEKK